METSTSDACDFNVETTEEVPPVLKDKTTLHVETTQDSASVKQENTSTECTTPASYPQPSETPVGESESEPAYSESAQEVYSVLVMYLLKK